MNHLNDLIKDKLKAIIDPDFNEDIVTLGFVKEVNSTVISESPTQYRVAVVLELTTPACPVRDEFKKQAEDIIQKIPEVKEVEIKLTARKKEANQESSLSTVKNIIAVASCKGGVGKSTVAALLASQLSIQGYRVGLLDLDIFGPSLPTLFNLSINGIPSRNHKLIPHEWSWSTSAGQGKHEHPLKLMSFGFLLGDAPAIMRGPMVVNYTQQLIHNVEWGDLDYLFIDLPPGTGDTQLTVSQSIRLDGAVIVTTPQSLSLVDVSKGIIMFEKVKIPILGLVENMAYFICGQCQHKHYPFNSLSPPSKSKSEDHPSNEVDQLKERFGITQLAQLPFMNPQEVSFKNYQNHSLVQEMVDKLMRELGKKVAKKVDLPQVAWDKETMQLQWGGKKLVVSHRNLRNNCRCALCIDEMTGEKKLLEKDIPHDIAPVQATPLGHYALAVHWNDRHQSSIYPYVLIEKISENVTT